MLVVYFVSLFKEIITRSFLEAPANRTPLTVLALNFLLRTFMPLTVSEKSNTIFAGCCIVKDFGMLTLLSKCNRNVDLPDDCIAVSTACKRAVA